jgi:MerR family transcriptional regulator, copper efflux regulator
MMGRVTGRSLRIGQIAAQAGIIRDTVRHYERLGIIPKAARTTGGYRLYSESAIERIRFVRNAVRFGFSLKQIGRFLNARDSGRPPCRDVRDRAAQMASEMDRQIDDMIAARTAIRQMLSDWDRRLATTPAGHPARLLDTLSPRFPSTISAMGSHLNRTRR